MNGGRKREVVVMADGLRIVAMGSGALLCPAMEAIAGAGKDRLALAVTQPDKPAGRGKRLTECPAKATASRLGVEVRQPADVNDGKFVEELQSLRPDVLLVAAYGQFLGAEVLGTARFGAINIHPSLLPRWRGASPMQWALAEGDAETGVTVLYVTERMDAGDILAQERTPVGEDETLEGLSARLAETGARMMMEVLDRFREAGTALAGRPQGEEGVIRARKLKKEDAVVDWSREARVIRNRFRGVWGWPGAETVLPDGTPLKIHGMALADGEANAAPGTVIRVDAAGPTVACGGGTAVTLTEVQPAGKSRMAGAALVCGRKVKAGDVLGGAAH